jgi:hypothetical protein
MKTTKLLSITFAAGLAGVALAELGNVSLLAALPGDKLFALGASVALIGFAVYDYSRRHLPLRPKTAAMARPSLPSSWRVAPAPGGAAVRRVQVSERTAA